MWVSDGANIGRLSAPCFLVVLNTRFSAQLQRSSSNTPSGYRESARTTLAGAACSVPKQNTTVKACNWQHQASCK